MAARTAAISVIAVSSSAPFREAPHNKALEEIGVLHEYLWPVQMKITHCRSKPSSSSSGAVQRQRSACLVSHVCWTTSVPLGVRCPYAAKAPASHGASWMRMATDPPLTLPDSLSLRPLSLFLTPLGRGLASKRMT